LDKKCVNKAKCVVVFDLMIQKFDLSVLQSVLFLLPSTPPIFQIEALFNYLLYIEFVITLLMPLLTTMQLFVDRLLSTFVTTTLLSLVVVVTSYMM
jgi:hypothetical protein